MPEPFQLSEEERQLKAAETVSALARAEEAKKHAHHIDLSRHFEKYIGKPGIVDLLKAGEKPKLSYRHTSAKDRIARFATVRPNETLRIADLACGHSPIALFLPDDEHTRRIDYWAVDRSSDCIDGLQNLKENGAFNHFGNFEPHLADLKVFLESGNHAPFDIMLLNNTLHELPPSWFPEMFEAFTKRLHASNGMLFIVDMQALQSHEPEAIAINWSDGELRQILAAGGLRIPVVVEHSFGVRVVSAEIPVSWVVDKRAMREKILALLCQRLKKEMEPYSGRLRKFEDSLEHKKQWLHMTGTVTRLLHEIRKMVPNFFESIQLPPPAAVG